MESISKQRCIKQDLKFGKVCRQPEPWTGMAIQIALQARNGDKAADVMLEAAWALCERSSTEGKWLQNQFGSDLKCSRAIWDRSDIRAREIKINSDGALEHQKLFSEAPEAASWSTQHRLIPAIAWML